MSQAREDVNTVLKYKIQEVQDKTHVWVRLQKEESRKSLLQEPPIIERSQGVILYFGREVLAEVRAAIISRYQKHRFVAVSHPAMSKAIVVLGAKDLLGKEVDCLKGDGSEDLVKTLTKTAYEAYRNGVAHGQVAYQWEDLPEKNARIWRGVVEAVLEKQKLLEEKTIQSERD